jgi:hypothetical protein
MYFLPSGHALKYPRMHLWQCRFSKNFGGACSRTPLTPVPKYWFLSSYAPGSVTLFRTCTAESLYLLLILLNHFIYDLCSKVSLFRTCIAESLYLGIVQLSHFIQDLYSRLALSSTCTAESLYLGPVHQDNFI